MSRFILQVLRDIGPDVHRIYVVDDGCPEQTGALVKHQCHDERVHVLLHPVNRGVGGAVLTGYRAALADGADVIVKLDGDGQMDATFIPALLEPVLAGRVDYTKGNRFHLRGQLSEMPLTRVVGNAALSLMTKVSSGYWQVADPTNGMTCINAQVAACLPLEKLSQRYFFESDILFRLNMLHATVQDIPVPCRYGDEVSGLRIRTVIPEFLFKHARNFCKRLVYTYILRDTLRSTHHRSAPPR